LLDAVDVAQRDGTDADARILWDAHVLKSAAHKAYIPFTISLDGLTDSFERGRCLRTGGGEGNVDRAAL
jgi:hypothetical protein